MTTQGFIVIDGWLMIAEKPHRTLPSFGREATEYKLNIIMTGTSQFVKSLPGKSYMRLKKLERMKASRTHTLNLREFSKVRKGCVQSSV